MSDWTIAPAASAALGQATLLWPERSRASDGTIGDPAHFSRRSWHNPCNRYGTYVKGGTVCAFDLTHDPLHGCDAHRLVRELVARGDQRVSEVISRGQIWTRARAAEGWRAYDGANRHDKHAHVTVAWAHRNDTSPWWRTSEPVDQEDDMTPAQEAKLDKVLDILEALVRPRRSDKADHDVQAIDLGDVLTKIERETP